MPIYEYYCDSCGHQVEVLQSIREAALTDCPQCHKSALKKRVSAAGFRLSGSGWYETDFKSGNKRNVTDRAANKEKKKDDSSEKAKPASSKSTSTATSKETH